MDSSGPSTVVLTVASQNWWGAINHLEERCARIVSVTLESAAKTDWLLQSEISLLLSDDEQISQLNRQYRQKERSTNVLSFPNLDIDQGWARSCRRPPGPILLGDIAMSFERLAAEASTLDKPVRDHFAHLLVHGTLHLLGYDHTITKEAEVMEAMEETILASLGMAAPYDDPDEAVRPLGASL